MELRNLLDLARASHEIHSAPMLTTKDTLTLLAQVARLDGPANAHELAILGHVAGLLAISQARCASLVAAADPKPLALAARTRAPARFERPSGRHCQTPSHHLHRKNHSR